MRKDNHVFDVFAIRQQLAQIEFNDINEKPYDSDTKIQATIDKNLQWEVLMRYIARDQIGI